jgi:hypothetical protein
MRKTTLSIVLLALTSICAHAAELEIPRDFEFLAVDGRDLDGWFGTSRSIDLTPGRHKIALKYSGTVPDENPRLQDFISSEPLLLTLEVEGNHHYTLVPHPSMEQNPREYAKNPKIKVVRDDRGPTSFDVALLVERTQSKLERITQNYDSNENTKPASDMERLTSPESQRRIATQVSSIPTPATGSSESPAAGMLNYWWNQADQATRERFLKQILK